MTFNPVPLLGADNAEVYGKGLMDDFDIVLGLDALFRWGEQPVVSSGSIKWCDMTRQID